MKKKYIHNRQPKKKKKRKERERRTQKKAHRQSNHTFRLFVACRCKPLRKSSPKKTKGRRKRSKKQKKPNAQRPSLLVVATHKIMYISSLRRLSL
jgi:hypothetical protein